MSAATITERMLEAVHQHRLLTTGQLHALFTPDRLVRRTRRRVADLEHRGLVAAVRRPGGEKVVYLTAAGAATLDGLPTGEHRRKLLDAAQASGPLQRHTLAVNDVGLAFVAAAGVRGDEFGPLSWHHEVAHPIGPAPGRRRPEELIADAVLVYQQAAPEDRLRLHYRFLELDRATMSTTALAAKLARYARLYRHTIRRGSEPPVRFWETRYPVFPAVLLVLDGGTPAQLQRRRRTVLTLCAGDPDLRRAPEVKVFAALLSDLTARGPWASIWATPRDPRTPRDWLGQPGDPHEPER